MCLLSIIFLGILSTSFAGQFGNLIISEPQVVKHGDSVILACQLPSESQAVKTCSFKSPSNQVFVVRGEEVLDAKHLRIDSYKGLTNSQQHCGISIDSIAGHDIGTWYCQIERSASAIPNIKGAIHLESESSKTAQASGIRLPRNTIPSHYELDIIADVQSRTITGLMKMDAIVAIDFINDGFLTIHSNGLDIDESSISLFSGTGPNIQIVGITYDTQHQYFTIQYVPPFVDASFPITVTMSYLGTIQPQGSTLNAGFYIDRYIDQASQETREIAVTQFETIGARMAFPCLDEPDLKATFTIKIGREERFTSISNMPLAQSYPVPGYEGYVYDEYQATFAMSSYLVAFAITDYSYVDSIPLANGVQFRTWARQDLIDAGYASYARDLAPRIIETFEEVFGFYIPPKLDQAAFPSKGGGMENWGFITYGERSLLIDLNEASAADQESLATVNAHEIAHQWFGDTVTCKWWEHIWLNEGFATFVSYIGVDGVAPEMQSWNRFYYDIMHSIMAADSLPSARPILKPLENPIFTDFGSVTYNKGASMIRMMEYMLTTPTIARALGQYLGSYAFSNTETPDLLAILNNYGHQDGTLAPQYDLQTIMEPWLNQKNFPLLTVTRDYTTGEVQLSQERFLLEPDILDPADYQWYVPISYTLVEPGQTDFNATIHTTSFLEPGTTSQFSIGISNAPVIFNIQNTGFFRTNYDQENWNRIAAVLSEDHTQIHVINRAQILGDAFNLAKAGIESYSLALDLSQYLASESEYTPFSEGMAALKELNGMSSLLPEQESLRAYLDSIVSVQYDRVGLAENPSNSFMDDYFQWQLLSLANTQKIPNFVSDANAVFAEYMANPSINPVNRQARYPVYCTAVRTGGPEVIAFLNDREAATLVPQELRAIRNAKGCSNSKDLLQKLLITALTQDDMVDIFKHIAENPMGKALVWKFVQDRFEFLQATFPMIADILIETLTETLYHDNTIEDLNILDSLVMEHKEKMSPGMLYSVERAAERIKFNIKWSDRQQGEILEWLRGKGY